MHEPPKSSACEVCKTLHLEALAPVSTQGFLTNRRKAGNGHDGLSKDLAGRFKCEPEHISTRVCRWITYRCYMASSPDDLGFTKALAGQFPHAVRGALRVLTVAPMPRPKVLEPNVVGVVRRCPQVNT